ncbi:hypothetical protein H8D91_01735 [archaeon]|nr:hypothetical protein [archaeon]
MGNSKKYLFVCLANSHRSPTGKDVFTDMLQERGYTAGDLEDEIGKDFLVVSCGTRVKTYEIEGARQYTAELGEWADVIFSADKYVDRELWDGFEAPMKKVINLEIPDIYKIYLPNDLFALRNLLRERLAEYVPEKKK